MQCSSQSECCVQRILARVGTVCSVVLAPVGLGSTLHNPSQTSTCDAHSGCFGICATHACTIFLKLLELFTSIPFSLNNSCPIVQIFEKYNLQINFVISIG